MKNSISSRSLINYTQIGVGIMVVILIAIVVLNTLVTGDYKLGAFLFKIFQISAGSFVGILMLREIPWLKTIKTNKVVSNYWIAVLFSLGGIICFHYISNLSGISIDPKDPSYVKANLETIKNAQTVIMFLLACAVCLFGVIHIRYAIAASFAITGFLSLITSFEVFINTFEGAKISFDSLASILGYFNGDNYLTLLLVMCGLILLSTVIKYVFFVKWHESEKVVKFFTSTSKAKKEVQIEEVVAEEIKQ